MPEEPWTGVSLEEALRGGELERPGFELVGMVKAAEEAGRISFSRTGCNGWVDIPSELIERAEHIGEQPCHESVHPVFRLHLKQPKDPEAKVLAALLMSSGPSAPPSADVFGLGSTSNGGFAASTIPGLVAPGSPAAPEFADGFRRLKLGCTYCQYSSLLGAWAHTGNMTCYELVCWRDPWGHNRCQVEVTTVPCSMDFENSPWHP
jgi:hypothetical protein